MGRLVGGLHLGSSFLSLFFFLFFFLNDWLGLSPLLVHALRSNVPLLPGVYSETVRGLDGRSEGEDGKKQQQQQQEEGRGEG